MQEQGLGAVKITVNITIAIRWLVQQGGVGGFILFVQSPTPAPSISVGFVCRSLLSSGGARLEVGLCPDFCSVCLDRGQGPGPLRLSLSGKGKIGERKN